MNSNKIPKFPEPISNILFLTFHIINQIIWGFGQTTLIIFQPWFDRFLRKGISNANENKVFLSVICSIKLQDLNKNND